MVKTIEQVLPYMKDGKHSTWVHKQFPGINYEYAVLFTDKTKGIFSSKKEISPFNKGDKVNVNVREAKKTKNPNYLGKLGLRYFDETFHKPNPDKVKGSEKEIAELATSTAIAVYIATTEHLDFKSSETLNKLKQMAFKMAPIVDDVKQAVLIELNKDKT